MSWRLARKRVVNTRAVHQAAELDRLLRERGAIPVSYPCIAIAPPPDAEPLDRELCGLLAGEYDWLILTSANAVEALAQRLPLLGHVGGQALPAHVATVGPATAEAVRSRLGARVEFMPESFNAEALAAKLPVSPGQRVLIPASAIARSELSERLSSRGANVTTVTAYRTIRGRGGEDVPGQIAGGAIAAVSFCSPSAVEGFCERYRKEGGEPDALQCVGFACIGGTTLTACRRQGLPEPVVASESTLPGLVEALERAIERQRAVEGGRC